MCRKGLPVLCRYLQVGNGDYPFCLDLTNGLKIELHNFHDLVTAWVVFFRIEYRVPAYARTILDLGANIGCFSLKTLADFPSARVIAVEPFPPTFDQLVHNLGSHGFGDRIRTWRFGVAGSSGSRKMVDSGPRPSLGFVPEGVSDTQTIDVLVDSLGSVLAKACAILETDTVDFVKMDIEGAEHEAILAARPPELLPIQALGMEYHQNGPKDVLFAHLSAAGLRLVSDRVLGRDVGVAHFQRK